MTSAHAIEAIRETQACLAVVTSGGGRPALDWLSNLGPAIPRTEPRVLVEDRDVDRFLGTVPDEYCSDRTARAMAMRQFSDASERILAEGKDLEQLVAAAAVARPAPGAASFRAYVAIQTATFTEWTSCDGRGAAERDAAISELLVDRIAAAVSPQYTGAERRPAARVTRSAPNAQRADLLAARTSAIAPADHVPPPELVFPGAFDPLHAGHRRMADHAARRCGRAVHFELSITNVDKPAIDFLEMEIRCRQFDAGEKLWLTRAPTFVEKSQLFPGATFVVGADTLRRLDDLRYYDRPSRREHAFAQLRQRGCRLLVFGRLDGPRFETAESLPVSPSLKALCTAVGADEFRADVSSSDLRRGGL